MRFKQLIETVSKKSIPSHQKRVIVEVMVSDEDDEDVEVGSDVCRIYARC